MSKSKNMKKMYVYNKELNTYFEFSQDEFSKFYELNHKDIKTIYIFNNELNIWTGYPSHIAYKIMMGDISHDDFINNIKNKLMMI